MQLKIYIISSSYHQFELFIMYEKIIYISLINGTGNTRLETRTIFAHMLVSILIQHSSEFNSYNKELELLKK